jgi:hypothetical protein
MLNDMHNAYMEEFEKVNGPIEHKE